MYCYQCQETAKGIGCTSIGVCGKKSDVAELQDLYIYLLKGLSTVNLQKKKQGLSTREVDEFITCGLFSTITNVNFDANYFLAEIDKAIQFRETVNKETNASFDHDAVSWYPANREDMLDKAKNVGVLSEAHEDLRSLKELLIYGLKGIAAYYHHATALGYHDDDIPLFMQQALASTLQADVTGDMLTNMVLECGRIGVQTMALLDKANTSTYGNPEITSVSISVGDKPGILISGHDLKDLEELLKQTKGTGIDVYSHGEMLPANAYPFFKQYDHFIGNYGGSWWKQKEEFDSFNGPILMTTNCLVPPKDSYKDRVYTTSIVGFPGLKHIPDRIQNGEKDFSSIIAHAKECLPPLEIEQGDITIGFAHHATLQLADKVLKAVQDGKIQQFVVMAGCDGRHKDREYYTMFAKRLPKESVILTAGCAKYRYNKLTLGDIDGIPRILDAGQCNDSYSLVVIAQKLAEALGVGINDLPIIYNIAWYEQKAVLVLLSLLSLGVKNIMLGPCLPAFVSPGLLQVLVETFGIMPNTEVEDDLSKLLGVITSP
ncbi:MAG: hydroxylamine reductase [Candidatus Thermoplasmatota archaeon]|nr:hydroxylamine reductase [Candidatus Thermoplasmatota archaeon]